VLTTAPIAAQGVDQTGQPVPGLTPDALKTAFELSSGGESELIEAGKGEYFAVKVEKVIPRPCRRWPRSAAPGPAMAAGGDAASA
jgi:peptidyl-prolyl cis-trans isomerase D